MHWFRIQRFAALLLICGAGNCAQSGSDDLSSTGLLAIAYSGREFRSSFESVSEFDGSYIVPQNYQSAASHNLSTERVFSGSYSHKGWIYSTAADSHRAYPTVQFHKLPGGSFRGPVYMELMVYLENVALPTGSGHWFSFITVARRSIDSEWEAVTVNLGYEGMVHVMHVPTSGQKQWTYQSTDRFFPQNQWVKLGLCIDMDPQNGYARAYQDGVLVSAGPVHGLDGSVPQVHYGLYAYKDMNQGGVYNDDLYIKEVLLCP